MGLTSGSEAIATFGFAPDGRLVIGTVGSFKVPGVGNVNLTGKDEDLIIVLKMRLMVFSLRLIM